MGRGSNENLLHMRYRFPKGCRDHAGRTLGAITVRETDGYDEQDAAKALDGNPESTFIRELFRFSCVAIGYVDAPDAEVTVEPPFPEFDGWPTRSKNFALQCFDRLNGVPDMEEHLKNGEAVDPRTRKATQAKG